MPQSRRTLDVQGCCAPCEGEQPSAHTGRKLLAMPNVHITDESTKVTSHCTLGWMPKPYGVMSNLFAVKERSVVVNATLDDCISACKADPACHAFSRDRNLGEQRGSCLLKRTLLGKGDVPAAGLATYAVRCPTPLHKCRWRQLGGHAFSGEVLETVVTHREEECRMVCGHMAGCGAVSYSLGECRLLGSSVGAVVDNVTVSAVCYREDVPDTCAEGVCGSNAVCLPYAKGHVCACAEGFRCVANCTASGRKTCVRAASLAELLIAATAATLRLDTSAVHLKYVSRSLVAKTPGPIKYSISPVRVNLTHAVSVTVRDVAVCNGSAVVAAFAGALGVDVRRVALLTTCRSYAGKRVSCVDGKGRNVSLHPVMVQGVHARSMSGAAAWCAAENASLPEWRDSAAVEATVRTAEGHMRSSRRYWTGAHCASSCADAGNWVWANGAPVDWTALNGVPETGKSCAVLQLHASSMQWRLVAESCSLRTAFALCVNSTAPSCPKGRCPDVHVTLSVVLPYTRRIPFVAVPGGAVVRYTPSVVLPAHTPIMQEAKQIGTTNAAGRPTGFTYPPVDRPENAVLKAMPQAYASEALAALLTSSLKRKETPAVLRSSSTCHASVQAQNVRCANTSCAAYVTPSLHPLCVNTPC